VQEPLNEASVEWWARDRNVAGFVFLLALGVRLLHLREIQLHDPFYTIPSVDGAVYDAWARELLAGEWLGEGVLFLGPLYPIFMAMVYSVFGESLPALKAVQAFIGAGSCVLVWGLTRELFDRRVAALAGGIAVFYGMHIFYGATAMIVNLQVPLVVGLVWATLRALRRPSFLGWALCGGLLGLSALARQTVLLIAPVVALWILFGMAGEYSFAKRFAFGTTFGVLILSLILPFTIKNYVAGDDFVLLNSTGGANFYMGVQPGSDGTWQVPSIGARYRVDNPRSMRDAFTRAAESAQGRALKSSEVSSYWLGRGLEEVRSDPMRWIGLELRKFSLFFNAYEVWNNRSMEVSKRFSWILRLPLPSFGLIAPLGLLGLGLTLRRWRELVPVHATIGAYLASTLLFFALSRYRMPATILFIPFASFAIIDLVDRLRNRDIRAAGLRTGAIVLITILVHLPLTSENRMQMAYYNLGNKFRELERWDEAIAAYHDSLAENPQAISTHNNLALSYELAGRTDEAIAAWQTVARMAAKRQDPRRMKRATRHLRELGVGQVEKEEAAPHQDVNEPDSKGGA
jgi:4-amino-4-deoxy-L-arabinose transferase-like glycosyltransferase